MAPKVLIVFTSNDKLVNSDHKTGYYLPEVSRACCSCPLHPDTH